jgi:hypothetical protein
MLLLLLLLLLLPTALASAPTVAHICPRCCC